MTKRLPIIVLAIVCLTGCDIAQRDAAQIEIDNLSGTVAALKAEIEATSNALLADPNKDTPEFRAAADRLADLITQADKFERVLADAQSKMDALEYDEDGNLKPESAIGTIGAIVPPPWGALIGILGVGAVGIYRELQAKKVTKSIVTSIERTKAANPDLASAFKAAGPVIASKMTSEAKAAVQKITT